MRRRAFIAALGGASATWSFATSHNNWRVPQIGYLSPGQRRSIRRPSSMLSARLEKGWPLPKERNSHRIRLGGNHMNGLRRGSRVG